MLIFHLILIWRLKASILFDTQTRENYPAFTAFARNSKGKITGVQAVYLKFGRR
ncbi:hypothetical protein [Orientia tsutsugamushi]|uniref:hypothetical protein n=1 Tax=Orientia tsutsugamushi TaxID=784 RepID=UPI000A492F19|nr:hypothetical protein [Orientia tsutsugamushi]